MDLKSSTSGMKSAVATRQSLRLKEASTSKECNRPIKVPRSPPKGVCDNQLTEELFSPSTIKMKYGLDKLSQVTYNLVSTGREIITKENCNTLFTEESLDPAKFFSDSSPFKDFARDHLSTIILSDCLLVVKKLLDNETKLYCLYLLSVTSDESLAESCKSALTHAGGSGLSFDELTSVLLNWGLELPSLQLPHQLTSCKSSSRPSCSLPQNHNIDRYFRVLAASIGDLSLSEVTSLLPVVFLVGLDPLALGALASITLVIDACLQVDCMKSYPVFELVKQLSLDKLKLDEFAFICIYVMPKTEQAFNLLLHSMHWYLCNIFHLNQFQTPLNLDLSSIVSLLAQGQLELDLLGEDKLYQILNILEAIIINIRFSIDDQVPLDELIHFLSHENEKLKSEYIKKSDAKYCCLDLIEYLILLCNNRKKAILDSFSVVTDT